MAECRDMCNLFTQVSASTSCLLPRKLQLRNTYKTPEMGKYECKIVVCISTVQYLPSINTHSHFGAVVSIYIRSQFSGMMSLSRCSYIAMDMLNVTNAIPLVLIWYAWALRGFGIQTDLPNWMTSSIIIVRGKLCYITHCKLHGTTLIRYPNLPYFRNWFSRFITSLLCTSSFTLMSNHVSWPTRSLSHPINIYIGVFIVSLIIFLVFNIW